MVGGILSLNLTDFNAKRRDLLRSAFRNAPQEVAPLALSWWDWVSAKPCSQHVHVVIAMFAHLAAFGLSPFGISGAFSLVQNMLYWGKTRGKYEQQTRRWIILGRRVEAGIWDIASPCDPFSVLAIVGHYCWCHYSTLAVSLLILATCSDCELDFLSLIFVSLVFHDYSPFQFTDTLISSSQSAHSCIMIFRSGRYWAWL